MKSREAGAPVVRSAMESRNAPKGISVSRGQEPPYSRNTFADWSTPESRNAPEKHSGREESSR
jgi:hypothetical protein